MTPKVLIRASTALQGRRAQQNRNFSNIAIPIYYYSAIKLYIDPRLIYIAFYLSPSLFIPFLIIPLIIGSNISTSIVFSIFIPTIQYNILLNKPLDIFNLYSNSVLFQIFILVSCLPLYRISLRYQRALLRSSLFYLELIRINYI